MASESPHKERAILHVDMDAYYASVEVMDNPDLAGKPVIVGGTPEGRGVVSAASYEARKFGVHSAMSAYRARKLCPNGVFVSPRMSRYAELSHEIRDIFERFTPLIEPISLDEAFLDVTGSQSLFGTPVEIGHQIKRAIKDDVGLVASVGVAPNKFLAKLASDLEKPDGFVVITREDAEARLAPLPVGRLWGIGKVSQKSLARVGIHTVSDITRMTTDQLEHFLGSNAGPLQALARGIDDRRVVSHGEAKSVSAETTFDKDIDDVAELQNIVDDLSAKVARRMRKGGLLGYTVNLKARYADFTTVTRAITLTEATAQGAMIRDTARELLLKRLGRKGRSLRLIGIGLSHLVGEETVQASLFVDDDTQKNDQIDQVMDSLQDRFGNRIIKRGGRPKTGR